MAEWTHPRRAAKETISYLSQVEPVIDKFPADDHSHGGGDEQDEDDPDVGREQMLDNILEELKHQTASIMEDRQGSVVAEKIVRRLTPLQLRLMLSRCQGYMLSLANNRYSSHVLQTLLSVAGQVIEAETSSGDDGTYREEEQQQAGGDQQVDLMQDIVLSLVAELSGAWAELLADISGSHVGRGFLQVLGGLPILSEKRGRQSRHAHSIGTAVGPGRGSASTTTVAATTALDGSKPPAVDPEALEKWSTPYKHRVPRSFEKALAGVTSELESLPAGELQALACGTFGCPLLVMLLRVYGNLAVEPSSGMLPRLEEGSVAMGLVVKLLEWEDQERSADVVYAMSGESTASHFLEAVLWLSPGAFFGELYRRCFESKLLEFCEHSVSNFLVQSVLQRAEGKEMAEGMVEAIGDNAVDLLKARRAGVLWRATQACVRLGLKPTTQGKLLGDIAAAVLAGHTGAPPPLPGTSNDNGHTATEDEQGGDDKVASPPSDAFKSARAWVPALLSARLPGEGGLDRLFLNVPGARIVQNALLFDPPVAAPVLKAVAALPEALLAAVARDNMGSRCLLDPILEAAGNRGAGGEGKGGGKGKNKPAEDARRTMLRAFRGHLVAMACDRVAWHVLLKCFRGADMKDKRAITEELANGGEQAWSRMSGYPSGRSVLTECMVERFSRSPREWEEAFKSRDNRAKMLAEILAVESTTKPGKEEKARGKDDSSRSSAAGGTRPAGKLAPSPFNKQKTSGGGGGEEDADEEGGGKGKEKRRRQRGRGKRGKSSAGGAGDGGGGEGEGDAASGAGDGADVAEPASKAKGERSAKEPPIGPGGGDAGTQQGDAAESVASHEIKAKREKSDVEGGGVGEDATPATQETKKKKKKRKRQESGVGSAGGELDLSAVGDATKEVVPAEEQVVATSKKVETKKKSKKKRPAAESRDGDRQKDDVLLGTGAATSGEAGKLRAGKKKKRDKKSHGATSEEAKVAESPSASTSSARKEGADGDVAVVAEAATSSGKKRKKASSSGFRLF